MSIHIHGWVIPAFLTFVVLAGIALNWRSDPNDGGYVAGFTSQLTAVFGFYVILAIWGLYAILVALEKVFAIR